MSFSKGQFVFCKERNYSTMEVLEVCGENVKCSWVDTNGQQNVENFLASQLSNDPQHKTADMDYDPFSEEHNQYKPF